MESLVTLAVVICYVSVSAVRGSGTCLQSESGSVRLTGLNSSYVGYVQVCKSGYWVSIAYEEEEDWSRKNSIVTCRELGFQATISILNRDGPSPNSATGPLSAQQYYSVECSGLEERLVDCTWTIRTVVSRKKDAIVLCKEDPYNGEVMVVGVSGEDSEGIVALYNPLKTYRWSTICTTEWDDTDADVVCRQLGFSSGTSKSYSSEQEVLSKDLPRKRYNYFECSGYESRLSECAHHGPYPYQCSSDNYAGVSCDTKNEDTTVLNLNVALLAFMILISILLIIILSLLLRCTLKKFRKKPSSRRSASSEQGRESRVGSPHLNVVRTHLDLDMPYALLSSTVAPPSYEDTLVADQMVQQNSAPEYTEGDTVDGLQESEDVGTSPSEDNLLLSEVDTTPDIAVTIPEA